MQNIKDFEIRAKAMRANLLRRKAWQKANALQKQQDKKNKDDILALKEQEQNQLLDLQDMNNTLDKKDAKLCP